MFKNSSMTIVGLVVTILAAIASTFHVDFDSGKATELLTDVVVVIGWLIVYIGRVRQGDITWYGKKK